MDEKEEGILGSILLPSFHISILSVDDHINRKYAFKATHPNMRTYYFCTDAAKDMESWMKVMTDAALVHSEPIKSRLLKVEQCRPQDISNHITQNHRPVLTRPVIQNNERNQAEAERVRVLYTVAAVTTVTSTKEKGNRKQCDAERYGFQKEGAERDRPLTKINSIKLQSDQAAAVAANIRDGSPRQADTPDGLYRSPQVNGSGDQSPGEMMAHPEPHQTPSILGSMTPTTPTPQYPQQEPEPRALTKTSSMQQLEQWVRTQRVRNQDDDARSIMSYQTLPRNMPSHRAPPVMPHCGDPGYRTLPRNSMVRPDSICSMSPTIYDQALGMGLGLGISPADKRRSMRDDTMWQLYEWQQRVGYTPSPRPTSSTPGPYGTLPSPKTMINLSEHQGDSHQSIPPSPSHGSLYMYGGYSPLRSSYNHSSTRSEVGLPVYQGDITIDRRHSRTSHLNKYAYPPDRRPMPAGIPVQTITAQSLQGKTMSPEEYREHSCMCRPEEVDIDERPRSAVDQLCGGPVEKESGRPRMSVEEQLERIRKHQQGALREKKKGLHIMVINSPQQGQLGLQDNNTHSHPHSHSNTPTPSRSTSFTKENPFHSLQNRRQRDEVMSSDILELEASLREQEVFREQETPAEEIARLKEASHTDHYNMDRGLSVPEKVLIPEHYVESDPEEALSPEQEADKQKKVDRIKALIAKNSMQNVLSPLSGVLSPEEEATAQEQEKMINISYELAAEASKRSKLVAVCSLSSSSPLPEPQPSSSPPPSTQPPPQLTDGSHFMCV